MAAVAEPESVAEMAEGAAEPRIAKSLEGLVVDADRLKPHPRNPRRGDLTAIAESLERFGQLRPVLALADGTIVAGHHVYRAATELLGWDRVAATLEDMPPDEAEAYLIADNRLSDLGRYDDDALASVLKGMVGHPTRMRGTGYREGELQSILRRLAPEAPSEFQEIDPDEVKFDYQCPKCEHTWSGSPKPRVE